MAPLFLAFTLLPFVELYLLIRIGSVAGTLNTVLFVVLMGIVGAALAKSQGRKVLQEWREALAAGRVPEEGVLGGILVLAGGLLLITPGVVTDVLGFFCLLPSTRRMLAGSLQRYLAGQVARGTAQVHSYGFEWPPRPPQAAPGPRHRASPFDRPRVSGDVIDTEGEEIK